MGWNIITTTTSFTENYWDNGKWEISYKNDTGSAIVLKSFDFYFKNCNSGGEQFMTDNGLFTATGRGCSITATLNNNMCGSSVWDVGEEITNNVTRDTDCHCTNVTTNTCLEISNHNHFLPMMKKTFYFPYCPNILPNKTVRITISVNNFFGTGEPGTGFATVMPTVDFTENVIFSEPIPPYRKFHKIEFDLNLGIPVDGYPVSGIPPIYNGTGRPDTPDTIERELVWDGWSGSDPNWVENWKDPMFGELPWDDNGHHMDINSSIMGNELENEPDGDLLLHEERDIVIDDEEFVVNKNNPDDEEEQILVSKTDDDNPDLVELGILTSDDIDGNELNSDLYISNKTEDEFEHIPGEDDNIDSIIKRKKTDEVDLLLIEDDFSEGDPILNVDYGDSKHVINKVYPEDENDDEIKIVVTMTNRNWPNEFNVGIIAPDDIDEDELNANLFITDLNDDIDDLPDNIEMTDSIRKGYIFRGWQKLNGDPVYGNNVLIEDVTLYAMWERIVNVWEFKDSQWVLTKSTSRFNGIRWVRDVTLTRKFDGSEWIDPLGNHKNY